jgi:N utilization substance protein A
VLQLTEDELISRTNERINRETAEKIMDLIEYEFEEEE